MPAVTYRQVPSVPGWVCGSAWGRPGTQGLRAVETQKNVRHLVRASHRRLLSLLCSGIKEIIKIII